MVSQKIKKYAAVQTARCAACGSCVNVCPKNAVSVYAGVYAVVNTQLCAGCGLCARECPASVIQITARNGIA